MVCTVLVWPPLCISIRVELILSGSFVLLGSGWWRRKSGGCLRLRQSLLVQTGLEAVTATLPVMKQNLLIKNTFTLYRIYGYLQ